MDVNLTGDMSHIFRITSGANSRFFAPPHVLSAVINTQSKTAEPLGLLLICRYVRYCSVHYKNVRIIINAMVGGVLFLVCSYARPSFRACGRPEHLKNKLTRRIFTNLSRPHNLR